MEHANYEIVLVEEKTVFISDGFEGKSVFEDLQFVYKELNKNFSNRKIVCRNKDKIWYELFEDDSKYPWFVKVRARKYLETVPSDDKITGCPNSALIRQNETEPKLNEMPDYYSWSLKNNKDYFKDYFK